MMIWESISNLESILLKVSSITLSILKNLASVGMLDLRLTWKSWRLLLINVSAQQDYWWNILKLTSQHFITINCLTVMVPFMMMIWRQLLCIFEVVWVVLFIPIKLVSRSYYHAWMNSLIILVIHYVILFWNVRPYIWYPFWQ